MTDKVVNDARVYSDVQGLEQLRYQSKKDIHAAKHEVAKQFEAILMQFMLRSMREANKTFSSGLFDSDQMSLYQDLYDKQLSLTTSNGIGLADIIEKNIDQTYFSNQSKESGKAPAHLEKQTYAKQTEFSPSMLVKANEPLNQESVAMKVPQVQTVATTDKTEKGFFKTPEEFIKNLWASAKQAAKTIGADPRVLLAQAALETNWGKKVLPSDQNASTHNLFNIKADPSWKQKTTTMETIEQKNGVLVKEKANFRSYSSFTESFADYVKFLKENGRYQQALDKVSNAKEFVSALQQAGFATDTQYADKIMNIFSSKLFKNLTEKLE